MVPSLGQTVRSIMHFLLNKPYCYHLPWSCIYKLCTFEYSSTYCLVHQSYKAVYSQKQCFNTLSGPKVTIYMDLEAGRTFWSISTWPTKRFSNVHSVHFPSVNQLKLSCFTFLCFSICLWRSSWSPYWSSRALISPVLLEFFHPYRMVFINFRVASLVLICKSLLRGFISISIAIVL